MLFSSNSLRSDIDYITSWVDADCPRLGCISLSERDFSSTVDCDWLTKLLILVIRTSDTYT